MTETVVFIANGFTRENVRLQPWRYLYEIARRISQVARVVVITEGDEDSDEILWQEGLYVVRSRHLSVRCQEKLAELISLYDPKQLWWSVTPRSVAYRKVFRAIHCEKYALITCPLYSYLQLIRATLAGVPWVELRALWSQRIVPRRLFVSMLRSNTFRKLFVQSKSNADILARSGIPQDKLSILRVGLDPDDYSPVDEDVISAEKFRLDMDDRCVSLLYFGAIRKIRGFYALIDAFSLVAKDNSDAMLVVLARGADESVVSEVKKLVARKNLEGRVRVVGGWLSRQQVWAQIELTSLVVLPFVIVPSDIPIAILESLARGKPVVGSPIDGIPELISGHGVIVDPLDTRSFAGELLSLLENKDEIARLGNCARDFMSDYPDWELVGKQAMQEAGLVEMAQ